MVILYFSKTGLTRGQNTDPCFRSEAQLPNESTQRRCRETPLVGEKPCIPKQGVSDLYNSKGFGFAAFSSGMAAALPISLGVGVAGGFTFRSRTPASEQGTGQAKRKIMTE